MSLDLCKRLPVVLPEATMSRTIFRRVAEVLGIAGYCALHATDRDSGGRQTSTGLLPGHGSGLSAGMGRAFPGSQRAQAAGSDLHQVGLARFLAGRLRGGLGRHFFPDLDEATAAIEDNGHGFGAMGGEANVVFLPWVYYLVTGAGYLLAWGVLFRALKGRRLLGVGSQPPIACKHNDLVSRKLQFEFCGILKQLTGPQKCRQFAVALVVTFFLIWTKLPLRFEGLWHPACK